MVAKLKIRFKAKSLYIVLTMVYEQAVRLGQKWTAIKGCKIDQWWVENSNNIHNRQKGPLSEEVCTI